MRLSCVEVLSENEINKIDKVSKEILEETGVMVLSEEVIKIFENGGAKVDYDKKIVRIPEKVVNDCIKSTPSEFKLYNREKDSYLSIGKNLGYSGTGHNAINTLEANSPERRLATKKDVENFVKIADTLPNIHVVANGYMPQDVFYKSSLLHSLEVMANNTTKHVYFSPENVDETKALISMLKVISGENYLGNAPIATCQLSPISPLTWSEGTIKAVVEVAKSGIPLSILPEPITGVTAPITLAGTLTSSNVEELSAIVLAQIVNPGTPVIYAQAWTTFEMNKGSALIGTPECCLLSIAGAQLARYYNIPSHCIAFDTDSDMFDEQNGFEKMFNTIATLQAGTNLIVNAGLFATGMTSSSEQLIVDHEIVTFVYRYLEGINVSNDSIAKNVIQEVGQHKDYMTHPQTLKYIRSNEHAAYKVSNRNIFDAWDKSGKMSITENASSLAKEIIKEYQPKQLSREKQEKLKEIISDFESKFNK
jgi:trimethylamine--corrinoid protein Co-methyltransferase